MCIRCVSLCEKLGSYLDLPFAVSICDGQQLLMPDLVSEAPSTIGSLLRGAEHHGSWFLIPSTTGSWYRYHIPWYLTSWFRSRFHIITWVPNICSALVLVAICTNLPQPIPYHCATCCRTSESDTLA